MTTELPEPRDYIAGRWATPSVELTDGVEDPNTGDKVQHQRATDDDQIEAALAAADGAAAAWAATDPEARADVLDALASDLQGRVEESARLESATSGAVIGVTSMLGFITHGAFSLAAQMLRSGMTSETLTADSGNPVEVHRLGWVRPCCCAPGTLLHRWPPTRWPAPWPLDARSSSSRPSGRPTARPCWPKRPTRSDSPPASCSWCTAAPRWRRR